MADPRSCPQEEMMAAVIDFVRSGLLAHMGGGIKVRGGGGRGAYAG